MNWNEVLSRYFGFLKWSQTYQHGNASANILTVASENLYRQRVGSYLTTWSLTLLL